MKNISITSDEFDAKSASGNKNYEKPKFEIVEIDNLISVYLASTADPGTIDPVDTGGGGSTPWP